VMEEPRTLGAHAMTLVSFVLIRPKDVPRAQRLIARIERRRARRQRPAEFPWDAFIVVALFTVIIFAVLGAAIVGAIGKAIGWEQAGLVVGGGLGYAIGLSLMIWLFRARKRADSATVAGNPARGSD